MEIILHHLQMKMRTLKFNLNKELTKITSISNDPEKVKIELSDDQGIKLSTGNDKVVTVKDNKLTELTLLA